ncbi:TetR/AcrR family transcriptional regulator [Actinomadura viridis]|uniref:TetR/AcrR family transcriptional regulator n=1 Tax=Actinomadura viridis TaxID=58110 RepID=UPI003679E1CF
MPDEPATVWQRPERGARGPAPERSRAQITAVAVRLADADGLAAVSMRGVAAELGTGPASLYRYVGGREDLVDLMADAVAGEVDLTVPLTGDPVEDLAGLAIRTKEVHLRHPWLAELPYEPGRLGPRAIDYLEHGLRALRPVRLSGQAKMETIAVVNGLVALFARTEIQGRRSPTGRGAAQLAHLAQVVGEGRHPLLAELLAAGPAGPPEELSDLFPRLIRRVIAGLVG